MDIDTSAAQLTGRSDVPVDGDLVVAVNDAVVDLPRVEAERADEALGLDPADFASFYLRYRATLRRRASRFLTDQRDVDEVVQETFIKVFLALPELGTELAAVRFAHRVVVNMCIDRYRTTRRRPLVVDLDTDRFEPAFDEIDPLIQAEDAAIVRDALSRLSPEHRAALIKREIEEKSVAAIAAEMNIPEESVKHLMFRARRALRRLLVGTAVDPAVDLDAHEIIDLTGKRLAGAARSGTTKGLAALLLMIGGIAWVVSPHSGHSSGSTPPAIAIENPRLPIIPVPAGTGAPAGHPLKHSAGHRLVASPATGSSASTPSNSPRPTHHGAPAGHGTHAGHAPAHHPSLRTPYTVSGLGVAKDGAVNDQTRIVEAPGSYRSTSEFVATTEHGRFAMAQALSFASPTGNGDVGSVTAGLNPVVPYDNQSVNYSVDSPQVSVTPTSNGYNVAISGVAQPLGASGQAPISVSVTASYDPTLTTVIAEQIVLTPQPIPTPPPTTVTPPPAPPSTEPPTGSDTAPNGPSSTAPNGPATAPADGASSAPASDRGAAGPNP